jgi:hypothetical protein
MNRAQRLRSLESESRFNALQPEMIAGARALRTITVDGVEFKRGSYLPGEILQAIAPRNYRAMVTNRFLELLFSTPPTPAVQPRKGKPNARSRTRASGHARKKRGRTKQGPSVLVQRDPQARES